MKTPKKINIPEINEDLAYLCGVLTGDGYMGIREHKYEYSIDCGGNPADEIEFYDKIIAPLFMKLFDIYVKPKLRKTYGIRIWSKNLVSFLLNTVGLTRSPKNNIRVPKIFYTNKKLLFAFIRGLADTDFSFKLRKGHYPIIAGCSKSKCLMEDVSEILEENGFKVLKFFDYKVNDSRLKKGYNIINRIDLNGHKNFSKWIKLIGTNQPKNLKKIILWKEINKKKKKNN
jgi:hypothetical protein